MYNKNKYLILDLIYFTKTHIHIDVFIYIIKKNNPLRYLLFEVDCNFYEYYFY